LSYNALKKFIGIGTIRFHGFINNVTMQILLDSGSSNNFLQPQNWFPVFKSWLVTVMHFWWKD